MSDDSNKSKHTRIPVQTQISPEMEEKLEKRALAKEQFYRKFYFYRNFGIVLLVIGIPSIIFVYASALSRSKEKGQLLDSIVITDPLERLLYDDDVSGLITYSESMREDLTSNMLPRQLAALQTRRTIAEKLIELKQDNYSFKFGVIAKINVLMANCSFNAMYKLGQPGFRDELVEFSKQFDSDSDPAIRSRALLGLLTAQIHDYLLENSDENFVLVKQKLDGLFQSPTTTLISELSKIIPFIAGSDRADHIQEFSLLLSTKLQQQPNGQLRDLGLSIADELIVGPVNYGLLRQLVLTKNNDAINQLKEIVKAVSSEPNVSFHTYLNALSVVDNLREAGNDDASVDLIRLLRTASKKIADDDHRVKVTEIFKEYDKRFEMIGQKLDLPVDSQDASHKDFVTIVGFFSAAAPDTEDWLSSLKETAHYSKLPVKFVLVSIDDEPDTFDVAKAREIFPGATIIDSSRKGFFLKQFPISWAPYLVILDKDQQIRRINADLNRIREQVLELIKSNF